MAQISTFVPSKTGAFPVPAAAAADDTAECGDHLWLHVRNANVAAQTVTLAAEGTVVTGDDIPDKDYPIESGEEAMIPLLPVYANPTDGLAHITWSATSGVTRCVLRM